MKTIGIIGGMGPLATADLYRKMILMTDAASDSQHPHIIIDGNTDIPDRSAAILRGEKDPGDELARTARRLQQAGAEVLAVACNTAHYWYDRMAEAVEIPVLHMPELTLKEIQARGYGRVSLLATEGTYRAGVYGRIAGEMGLELMEPDEAGRGQVMDLIYKGIKAGDSSYDIGGFTALLRRQMQQGAEAFILGCTELPVAFEQYGLDLPAIDPSSVLAAAALRFAGARLKERV